MAQTPHWPGTIRTVDLPVDLDELARIAGENPGPDVRILQHHDHLDVFRPVPEWKPGTSGTAETPDGPGQRVMRTEPRDLDAGDPRRGFIRTVWVDDRGTWLTDGEVDSFVPDDAEALRTEAARLGAAFDDLTERWKVQNSDLARLRHELEAEQRGRNALAAGLEAERDEAREFLDHLGFWLVAETRREPVTREQAVKYAIAEIEELQAEVNRLNGLIQSDAETSRKALAEVDRLRCFVDTSGQQLIEDRNRLQAEIERLRAARTLPTREQVAGLLARRFGGEAAAWMTDAASILHLFEQGGAAPKVTQEQAAEVLWLRDDQRPWSEATRHDWAVYMNSAAVVIARMGGAE